MNKKENSPGTEAVNPATKDLDQMSTLAMVQAINREDTLAAQALKGALPQIALAIDAITERMRTGGRLVYMGAGTSGRLGVLDASECPPTFNVPSGLVVGLIAGGDAALRTSQERAEDHPESGAQDLKDLGLRENDSLVGITASGSTPYVLGGLQYARSMDALTIGVACNHPAEISQFADIPILTPVGPEVISGSTRMKAGTAQKMVLNMLSTGVMVRLGKTFGNLMVDVQASNAKLRQRALRLLLQTCPIEEQEGQVLLEACDWQVKTAIAAFHLGCSPDEARDALARTGGHIRQVLENAERQNHA
ncbi:MAG: N-acetylmuramic acid 6-phosphate etherase [Anaerolineaceae bacterium]|nr:N-acetylmuramic acid 6-phosphate etherase [Anaerolineaceae bacterium]